MRQQFSNPDPGSALLAVPGERRRPPLQGFGLSLPRWLVSTALCLTLLGCVSMAERNPVPGHPTQLASIPGIPNARIWGDEPPAWIPLMNQISRETLARNFPATFRRPHQYLAISGGGADGAFGAGLLKGWTDSGKRPEFQIVTGVSTGALTAPFAFLGPDYDPLLKELYTSFETKDLITKNLMGAISGPALADTSPLRAKIAHYVNQECMEQIAAQHRRGRRLFIGTVNLDLARPVIWNIGAIADSGQPNALSLIHDIMLASAAIPGAFPPVYFKVQGPDGKLYEEMHVDGGTATQVFLYPLGLEWTQITRKLEVPGTPRAYVVRNSKITPTKEVVTPWAPKIAARSIASLIRTQGIGDMYRLYLGAKRDGLDFNLAYISDDFAHEPKEPFDREYMRILYQEGYQLALKGNPWHKAPPGAN